MSEQAKQIIMEVTRLGLRYLGMYLVMRGVFDETTSTAILADPAVAGTVGGIIIAITEAFFVRAKIIQVQK